MPDYVALRMSLYLAAVLIYTADIVPAALHGFPAANKLFGQPASFRVKQVSFQRLKSSRTAVKNTQESIK